MCAPDCKQSASASATRAHVHTLSPDPTSYSTACTSVDLSTNHVSSARSGPRLPTPDSRLRVAFRTRAMRALAPETGTLRQSKKSVCRLRRSTATHAPPTSSSTALSLARACLSTNDAAGTLERGKKLSFLLSQLAFGRRLCDELCEPAKWTDADRRVRSAFVRLSSTAAVALVSCSRNRRASARAAQRLTRPCEARRHG
ncbi:hypothetical protein C8R45DRAFT_1001353 [Mycena sanguinolenta]|nr:hypothetical protein C8R45DRAFT_1001353 [Mycena sanguinolenta]